MKLLAFDTCFNACSVAIGDYEGGAAQTVAARFEPMATGQAERLLPMISECLDEASLTMADIGKIAVTTGPGTFTGTRIGISAAKGLALVNRTPVVGLSSLHLLARQVALAANQSSDIGIIVDVRRDEYYVQLFDRTGLVAKCEPALMTLSQAQDWVRSCDAVLAGSGATQVAAHHHGRCVSSISATQDLPDAACAIDIIYGTIVPPLAVSPLYLRAPDAKPSSVPPLQRQ